MLAEKAVSNAAEVEKAYGGGDGEVVVLSTLLLTNYIQTQTMKFQTFLPPPGANKSASKVKRRGNKGKNMKMRNS